MLCLNLICLCFCHIPCCHASMLVISCLLAALDEMNDMHDRCKVGFMMIDVC